MDPTSALISGHAAGKFLDYVAKQFRTHVIEKWSRFRAEKFFKEFCQEVESELAGHESEKLDILLNKILEDDTRSEILFDAYRRVSFSRSKDFGPRIIGILTAQLVIKNRAASEIEDNMLIAAESLLDNELLEFAEFAQQYKSQAEDEKIKDVFYDKHQNLVIEWCKEEIDSSWNRKFDISVAPLNLGECLGRWSLKFKSFGIISDDVKERQWDYDEDSERHIDEPGTMRVVSWWIYMPKSYFKLADLVERVSKNN